MSLCVLNRDGKPVRLPTLAAALDELARSHDSLLRADAQYRQKQSPKTNVAYIHAREAVTDAAAEVVRLARVLGVLAAAPGGGR